MTAVGWAAQRAAAVRAGYAQGIDWMEMLDATYECPNCGRLDCTTNCAAVPKTMPAPAFTFPAAPLALPAPKPMLALPAPAIAVPDLMLTLNHVQEAAMATDPAPFGYKADGVTPRKRPAPDPATLVKARAARAAKRTAVTPTPDMPDVVRKVVIDLDAEIDRLRRAREAVIEAVAA